MPVVMDQLALSAGHRTRPTQAPTPKNEWELRCSGEIPACGPAQLEGVWRRVCLQREVPGVPTGHGRETLGPCRGRKALDGPFWWTWSWPRDEGLGQTQGLSFSCSPVHPTLATAFRFAVHTRILSQGILEWLESLLGSPEALQAVLLVWAGGSILTLGPEGCSLGRDNTESVWMEVLPFWRWDLSTSRDLTHWGGHIQALCLWLPPPVRGPHAGLRGSRRASQLFSGRISWAKPE